MEKESGMRNEQLLLSSGKAMVSRARENSPARVFANASERNITVRDCRFIRQRARTERRLTPINVSLSPSITSEGNEKPRGPSSAGKGLFVDNLNCHCTSYDSYERLLPDVQFDNYRKCLTVCLNG